MKIMIEFILFSFVSVLNIVFVSALSSSFEHSKYFLFLDLICNYVYVRA